MAVIIYKSRRYEMRQRRCDGVANALIFNTNVVLTY